MSTLNSTSEVIMMASSSDDDARLLCDESKCVAHDLDDLFGYSFTCYADGIFNPLMCTHGYIPRIVNTEPIIIHTIFPQNDAALIPYQYYTCCPPDLPLNNVNVSRHCSNSSSTLDNITIICEDENRPYPRQMASWGERKSFMCCDSSMIDEQLNNKTITISNFLNDTECVPFRNEEYMPSVVGNAYGSIYPIACNNKDIYSEFRFPRISNKTNYFGYYHYECCKTTGSSNNKTQQPFIQDSTFKNTVYPQIFVSTIAVISCIILITAILCPLWLHAVQKINRESTDNTNTNTNTNISTSTGTNRRRRRSRRLGMIQPSLVSGYNLYLVYLAIPDMILNVFLLGMYSSYALQKYNPTESTFSGIMIIDLSDDPFEGAFVIACSTANLYLNCVISYEVLTLLQNSYNATRIDPPSLFKVSLQAALVYLFASLVYIIHYTIGRIQKKAFENGNFDRYFYLNWINLFWSCAVTYIFPIIFFSYVWIVIWYRGYIPSATGTMKQLVWYFLRIFVVFYLIWLPGMCMLVVGTAYELFNKKLICIGYLFCGIQPIVSTCMAMTKSDVMKYTRDLITLSYIRKVRD